jgi:nucleoside-diphosphate-sugar epimerase
VKYLVTGAAGFIGNFIAQRLCRLGHDVVGLDNLNDYYDPNLKLARLKRIERLDNFRFVKMDLANRDGIANLFASEKFERVIHLAAQTGVRYSIENPMAYIDSNIVGFATILEGCRHNEVQHLVYASSSSVYGMNDKMPFSTDDAVDHPVSLYAATKKSNELMARTYSHLYDLPTTGLRFFTVYGLWGRPDILASLIPGAIGIYFAFKSYGVWALVIQQVLNQMIVTILTVLTANWKPGLTFSKEFAKEILLFSSPLMGAQLISTFSTKLFELLIAFIIWPAYLWGYMDLQ